MVLQICTKSRSKRILVEEDEILYLYNSKLKYTWLLIGCLAFVAIGVLILRAPDNGGKETLTAWFSILFFGAGVVIAIRQLLNGDPRIIIDETGITDFSLKIGKIDWCDIRAAHLRKIQRESFIELDLIDENKYLNRLSAGHRHMSKANELIGFSRLNINLSGVKVDPSNVLNIVRFRSAVARSKDEE